MNNYKKIERFKKNNYHKKIVCGNCGIQGHIYKYCKEPIISLGIILFRINKNIPEFLMIQRKNSVNYIEFIRGKYNLKDIDSLKRLFMIW